MNCSLVVVVGPWTGITLRYLLNSLLPLGRYINMDGPLPHMVAYILDLVHLIWTILFLLNLC